VDQEAVRCPALAVDLQAPVGRSRVREEERDHRRSRGHPAVTGSSETGVPLVGDGRHSDHGIRQFCPPSRPARVRGRGERVDRAGGRAGARGSPARVGNAAPTWRRLINSTPRRRIDHEGPFPRGNQGRDPAERSTFQRRPQADPSAAAVHAPGHPNRQHHEVRLYCRRLHPVGRLGALRGRRLPGEATCRAVSSPGSGRRPSSRSSTTSWRGR
jgi:hypothetical protein